MSNGVQIGDRATIWIETKMGDGYGPRAGELVSKNGGNLVFHSIGMDHLLAFEVTNKSTVNILADECQIEDVNLMAMEFWSSKHEIQFFHQDIMKSEPILYGDNNIFAVGWNEGANRTGYYSVIIDGCSIYRETEEKLPNFTTENGNNSVVGIQQNVKSDMGNITIHKLTLNAKPDHDDSYVSDPTTNGYLF